MLRKLKLILIGIAVAWIGGSIVFVWYVTSGRYNFAADDPHWGWVENLIHESVEHSVERRLSPTPVPDLTHPAVIAGGARSYDEMCAICHLKPGQDNTETRAGMYPLPPNLSREDPEEPKEAYFVIKHGIKMSGMPAWGPTHSEEEIWDLIAFLQVLPDLSADDYDTLIREGAGPEPVVVEGPGEFPLKGDLFTNRKQGPGVLMLHQCNAERSMYRDLGIALSARGIHALSIDLRGYGESVQERTNIAEIRDQADSREQYNERVAPIREQWPADVIAAYDYLARQQAVTGPIGVIGASCGGGLAAGLSSQRELGSLVLLSAGLAGETVDGPVHDFAGPILAISATGDGNNAQVALAVTQAARHGDSRLVLYKGGAHGYPLFDQDNRLKSRLVDWFATQLDAAPTESHSH